MKQIQVIGGCLLFVVILLGLIGSPLYFLWQGQEDPNECRYSAGSIVETVIANHRGQALWAEKYNGMCSYMVRLDTQSESVHGGLLSFGGDVEKRPLSRVRMKDFELK